LKHVPTVRTARILVVEDNVSDVFLLDRALKKQDFAFQLTHLLSGDAALAFIRREGEHAGAPVPDLVLLDLNLSKYSGEDILREMHAAAHFHDIPICVWSSSRSHRDETHLRSLGVCQFIGKPAGLDEFMAIGTILKDLVSPGTAGGF
jgi:DNA-binding response OmpR family regulator